MPPSALPPAPPRAAMTIDVEDWFHVENLRSAVARDSWDDRELRVEATMERLLAALAARNVSATFFVLGWLAERRPELVRAIADAGHEVACHGYGHDLVSRLTPGEFRRDVLRAKGLLEDLTGRAMLGYRAPCFSITDWAIDVLHEVGFAYDSSAFPVVRHDRYGRLSGVTAESAIAELRPGFHELCISVLRCGGRGIPWGGGGYFRLLPYGVFKRGVGRILDSGRPYVFYTHPWEFDPGQPRIAGLSRSARFRHYVNLHRTQARWEALLDDFAWGTAASLVDPSGSLSRRERVARPRRAG